MTEPTDAKPVAWLVPKLHTFKGAERVHFTRAPGCTMTDVELTEYMEGRVMWLPTTFCDSDAGVTDKFGVVHKPKPLYTTTQPTQAQAGAVPLTDEQIDAVAESMPGGLDGFLKGWGWRQFAREILTLRRMPDWEPQFDCMTPKQEELAVQFCQEIAGPRGKRGSPPDPVRLLEMAEALYKAEREHHHGIKGGQHG